MPSNDFLIPPPTSCSIEPIEILLQYYSPDSTAYQILLNHSIDVAALALDLCKKLPAPLRDDIDTRFVYEASILHDLAVFLTHAPKIGCTGAEPYIKHGYLGGELLREKGLPKHAQVCERHTGAGLTDQYILQMQLPLPLDRLYIPQSIEEKVVCFADKFFSKTRLGKQKTLEQARLSVSRHGQESAERFDTLANLFWYSRQ